MFENKAVDEPPGESNRLFFKHFPLAFLFPQFGLLDEEGVLVMLELKGQHLVLLLFGEARLFLKSGFRNEADPMRRLDCRALDESK